MMVDQTLVILDLGSKASAAPPCHHHAHHVPNIASNLPTPYCVHVGWTNSIDYTRPMRLTACSSVDPVILQVLQGAIGRLRLSDPLAILQDN